MYLSMAKFSKTKLGTKIIRAIPFTTLNALIYKEL
jgi:CRISPR/Cas system-associated endonuclease/helicase Cas3